MRLLPTENSALDQPCFLVAISSVKRVRTCHDAKNIEPVNVQPRYQPRNIGPASRVSHDWMTTTAHAYGGEGVKVVRWMKRGYTHVAQDLHLPAYMFNASYVGYPQESKISSHSRS